jgi:hypothetical protein
MDTLLVGLKRTHYIVKVRTRKHDDVERLLVVNGIEYIVRECDGNGLILDFPKRDDALKFQRVAQRFEFTPSHYPAGPTFNKLSTSGVLVVA